MSNWIVLLVMLFFGSHKQDSTALKKYIDRVRPYLKKGFNQDTIFYADLTRPSGAYRFYVLSMKQNKILSQGLCTNGAEDLAGNVIYSNVPNSNCSSKGAYRIGTSYVGRFGQAFKLHGLESTNNKAFERFIVLHGHDCVPAAPVGLSICLSQGCPTVNPLFLKKLAAYINNSERPLLLYIQ